MTAGSVEFLSAIPHRPPFLFIDEVAEIEGERILARKFVDPAMDCFRGHYPGNPVLPGVLICECCFQAGAILISHVVGGWNAEQGVPVLTKITDARFRRIVRPGETLNVEVTLDDQVDQAFYCTARAAVGGEAVVRVQFVCMLVGTSE